MPEQNLSQKFQVHYYFDDESHSMNAFVRNRAEKDLLEAVKRVSEILESPNEIETAAYQEGGLIETLALIWIGKNALNYFSPAINEVLKHHFTKNKTDDANCTGRLQVRLLLRLFINLLMHRYRTWA